MEAATHACELTEWKESGVWDTWPRPAPRRATSTPPQVAVKAHAMFPEGKEKSEGEARLKLYRAKTPYRMNTP